MESDLALPLFIERVRRSREGVESAEEKAPLFHCCSKNIFIILHVGDGAFMVLFSIIKDTHIQAVLPNYSK